MNRQKLIEIIMDSYLAPGTITRAAENAANKILIIEAEERKTEIGLKILKQIEKRKERG